MPNSHGFNDENSGDKNPRKGFWNFHRDFKFYGVLIVILLLILQKCGVIFNH